jgi:outer membrane protein TolC
MMAQEKAEILAAIHQLAHRLDRTWIEAVAAQQALGIVRQVHEAAQTAAELAQRMVKAGNWSQVPLLQAKVLASASATQVTQAQLQAFVARENLIQLTGLWGEQTHIDLPAQLPKLPEAPLPWANFETQALQNQRALATATFNARHAQAQVNPQDAAVLQKTLMAATTALAPSPLLALATVPLSAPVLPANLGRPNPALLEALTEQAHADLLAAKIRSEAREAWFRYRSAWDLARHQRDVVLPLSTALQEETQLRYNGMLQSTWELLASARARLDSVQAVTQSQRDFWLAHTDFQAVLAGVAVTFSPPSGPNSSGANAAQGH